MTATAPTTAIAGGRFTIGDDHHYPEERPARQVAVDGFAIDRHPVTNAQFAAFVAATGHVTLAESLGGNVFARSAAPVDLGRPDLWWHHVHTASWRRPDGITPLDEDTFDHPVVQVTHADAVAYASWAGGRLPTEAEWEWAAGSGQPLSPTWPLAADGQLLANVWIGEFPWQHTRRTAPSTTPVGAYPANPAGLFDMLGNVWEWTADGWGRHDVAASGCCASPNVVAAANTGVAKGGSYLCAANYCRRYRPAARHPQARDQPACHIGFRCAYDTGTDASHG